MGFKIILGFSVEGFCTLGVVKSGGSGDGNHPNIHFLAGLQLPGVRDEGLWFRHHRVTEQTELQCGTPHLRLVGDYAANGRVTKQNDTARGVIAIVSL